MPPDTSDTLQAEKDYLKTSRAALAVMREKTGALEVHSADRVNQEYLQAAIWRRTPRPLTCGRRWNRCWLDHYVIG